MSADALALDRYRLLERLGAGGFGVVWRAHDELLGREVALKRIPLGPGEDGERAAREAHASARLSHPAIVALYEACATDDAFLLISELVDGRTLAELIAADCLADEEVLEIGLALTEALVHAHARRVVHRDIKPQNVLVPEAGAVAAKLTDFGGASLVGEEALTRTGDVLGTLAYMAPEQIEGREVGAEADLYALALVLYEALSGVHPVRGATPGATARAIGTRLAPLRRHRRDLPRALCDAIDRALAPSPRDRGDVPRLQDALREALDLSPPAHAERRPAPPRPEPFAVVDPTARQRRTSPAAQLHRPHPAPEPPDAPPPQPAPHGRGVPRVVVLGCALALAVWQAASGRPGVALLALCALAPVLALSGRRSGARLGLAWLACALAPALGMVGLAGAFPAIAAQARRWGARAALGAVGYWWLALAEPLVGRRLWLGAPAPTGARASWEGSLASAASHVVGPLLNVDLLLVGLLWAAGAAAAPWIVRGRSAALDAIAATTWSAALVAAVPALDAGASPRGAVLGAIVGGLTAVGARALRGPV